MFEALTPLRVWSGYSLGRGTCPPQRLVGRARELGHTRLALTDVDNLCAAPAFWRSAVEAGLRPILGAELREGGRWAVVLVAEQAGYENLCRLITRRHCREDFRLAGGLAELCGGTHVLVEDAPLAEELLAAGVPRERLWVGIDPPAQSPARLRRLWACAGRLGLRPVATATACLGAADEAALAGVLAASRLGCTVPAVPAGELPPPGAVLRAPDELARAAAAFPAAARNNRRLAEECSAYRLLPRRPVFPRFPVPSGQAPQEYLRRLCERGLRKRYGEPPPQAASARLARELDLIGRLGFAEYFLVVWDIVRHARRSGAPVAGRGSGASSLVAYVLGLTNVCPLACDIPFERFLHEGRSDLPDLDIDFCWRLRDNVIDYAFRRWGEGRVAMVCTHNTYQVRSALRETAKAFGLSDEQISGGEALEADGRREAIVRLSRRLVGLPHLLSVHPGGVVIAPRAIDRHVPVQPAAKGVRIAQYDKDGVEAVGLVKLDLLGNRNLSTVHEACRLVRRRRGVAIDVERLPPAEAATVDLLRRAATVGCNQLESPAMRHLLRMMRPGGLADVMQALALIRPGAASIGMKEVFIRRRRGLEPVPPGYPAVDAILRRTCGVMLYEDDVLLVAAALLGEPLAEADRFRKAVQKCPDDRARLELSREFLGRCAANGVEPACAKDLWVQMAKFNAYSFCRAHAASYAALSYAGAYLKAHWPLEFWVAALNNNQSMYPPRVYVAEAQRAGVRFCLPDANRSGEEFTIDEDGRGGEAIRVGLGRVEGLGPAGVRRILDERARRPFADLGDFLARTRLGRQEARALILCGAFDWTGRSRPTLMMELNLFFTMCPDALPAGEPLLYARPNLPNVPGDYEPRRKRLDERRILGLSVGRHVMTELRPLWQGRVDAFSDELPQRVGRRVRLAGVLEVLRAARTERGQDMMFLTLDDERGLFEVTVFPAALARTRADFRRYGPYLVTGRAEDQYGAVTVAAEDVRLCDGAAEAAGALPAATRV